MVTLFKLLKSESELFWVGNFRLLNYHFFDNAKLLMIIVVYGSMCVHCFKFCQMLLNSSCPEVLKGNIKMLFFKKTVPFHGLQKRTPVEAY